MNNSSLFGVRLKEERKRLALSQDCAAAASDVSREMWGKYERGVGQPGGEVLAAIAEQGFDVAYLLTGVRPGEGGADVLSKRERALLEAYQSLTEELRHAVDLLLGAASEKRGRKATGHDGGVRVGQVIHGSVGQVIKGRTAVGGPVHMGVAKPKE